MIRVQANMDLYRLGEDDWPREDKKSLMEQYGKDVSITDMNLYLTLSAEMNKIIILKLQEALRIR
jgi:hypothetical protein